MLGPDNQSPEPTFQKHSFQSPVVVVIKDGICFKFPGSVPWSCIYHNSRNKNHKYDKYVALWDPGFIKVKHEMLFWQFSNLTTYIRNVEKWTEEHFNVSLFSNPGEKVMKSRKTTGQICPQLSTRIRHFSPELENYDTLKYWSDNFNRWLFSNS